MIPLALELPSGWVPYLRSNMQHVGDHQTIEVATLSTALAFGAPPRVVAVLEVEPNRARFAVVGAIIGSSLRSLRSIEEERWGAYWIGSLRDALEAEVHRRQWARPAIASGAFDAASVSLPARVARA